MATKGAQPVTSAPAIANSPRLILQTAADKVANEAQDVRINMQRLTQFAASIDTSKLEFPKWDVPVFLEGVGTEAMDFFLLGNAINFAYIDARTGKKYSFKYKDVVWTGAFAMWAALKSAYEKGVPIFDAVYLSGLNISEAEKLFNQGGGRTHYQCWKKG